MIETLDWDDNFGKSCEYNGICNGNFVADNCTLVSTSKDDKRRQADAVQRVLPTVIKDDRWVGCGEYPDEVLLTKDEGHLIWVDPKGILEVCFTYENTGQDFCCHINPQQSGVHIYQQVPKRGLVLILDGNNYQEPYTNWDSLLQLRKMSADQYIRVVSNGGIIKLVLHSIVDRSNDEVPVFKLCYTITL